MDNITNININKPSPMKTIMCKISEILTLPQSFQDFIDGILNEDSYRWVILFLCVLTSYIMLFKTAYSTSVKIPQSPPNEESETGLLLNPSLGGYATTRGDLNSPPLFTWNVAEISLCVVCGLSTLFLVWTMLIHPSSAFNSLPIYVCVISFLLAWSHTVLLLFFIPVNPFHRRMLYNLRCWAAQVCNDSLKELWMAFIFIVLIPLPGSKSHTERLSWFALKLGIFYVIQNFLLGSPNYQIEPVQENKSIPDSPAELVGYGVFVLFLLLLYFNELCSDKKININVK